MGGNVAYTVYKVFLTLKYRPLKTLRMTSKTSFILKIDSAVIELSCIFILQPKII